MALLARSGRLRRRDRADRKVSVLRRFFAVMACPRQCWPTMAHHGATEPRRIHRIRGLADAVGRPYHPRPALHPQTQGKDERFHRTLNVELLQSNRFTDLAHCQRAFDTWRRIYNEERPHEALGLDVPASRYCASQTSFPERLPEPEYHACDIIRRVRHDGYVSFKARKIILSRAFAKCDVAFRPTAVDGVWNAFFMRFKIANLDLRDKEPHSEIVRDVSGSKQGEDRSHRLRRGARRHAPDVFRGAARGYHRLYP